MGCGCGERLVGWEWERGDTGPLRSEGADIASRPHPEVAVTGAYRDSEVVFITHRCALVIPVRAIFARNTGMHFSLLGGGERESEKFY